MSTMFSSPVSIMLSSGRSRRAGERIAAVGATSGGSRKPTSTRLMRVTRGVVWLSIGQGRR
jgi:hypothetical protein